MPRMSFVNTSAVYVGLLIIAEAESMSTALCSAQLVPLRSSLPAATKERNPGVWWSGVHLQGYSTSDFL